MRRGLTLSILMGLASASGLAVAEPEAVAHEGKRWRPPVTRPAVTVTLADGHGRSLSTIRHRGRDFVVGDRGDRYEIHLRNNTSSRMEVVVTVDGLDVVSGRPGDFSRQRGYVLPPFGSVTIDGFRTSLHTVAAFRFSDVGSSFAAQSGMPDNAGIIGIAAFKERAPAVASESWRSGSTSSTKKKPKDAKSRSHRAPSPSAPSGGRAERWDPAPSQQLGTEFGEERRSTVREVPFVRASARRPDFRTSIQYDSARGLAARGVPVEPEPVIVDPPAGDAWPGATDSRWAQPPPGWRRHGRRGR